MLAGRGVRAGRMEPEESPTIAHDRPARRRPTPELVLYVSGGCAACRDALFVMARAQRRFPGMTARVVDLDVSSEPAPDDIFAVPTFTLDGDVISLGTPAWDALVRRLLDALKAGE